jgi:diguanylate cyclase
MSITMSVGLSEFKTNDTLESAFERADQALYGAKSAGRNRCQQA